MTKPKKMTKTADIVLATLKSAAMATLATRQEALAVGEKRKGAYALFVQAATEAGTAEVLELASNALFTMIRATGAIDGTSIGCKQNKDQTAYIVPSAISSAKSVLTAALVAGVALEDKGDLRSFTAIREEVQEIARTARESQIADADKLKATLPLVVSSLATFAGRVGRLELVAINQSKAQAVVMLHELADLIGKEENAADLVDLLDRVNGAMRDYGYESPADKVAGAEPEIAEQTTDPTGSEIAELMKAAAPRQERRVRRKGAIRNSRKAA